MSTPPMPTATPTQTASTSGMSPWRAALAAMAGSVLEYYDFFVYGPLAVIVFGKIFFSGQMDPALATLMSLLTFAAGFLARPIGGIVIGHFGDRIGRKSMLLLTFMITGIATILIGCLPTYSTIGIAAPILLTVLRFVQGFGIGGEWGGAALLAVESAPPQKKAFFGSIVQAGAPVGVMLSTATVAIVTASMPLETLIAWGWRIPFIVSLALVLFGLWLRTRIEETPEFEQARKRIEAAEAAKRAEQLPVWQAITRYPREILAMVGTHMSDTTLGLISGVFVIGFATTVLGMNTTLVLVTNMASSVANLICTPIAGRLADRWGARRVLAPAVIFLGLWAFPAFWLIETRSFAALFAVMIVNGMVIGTLFSPQASLFPRVIPARVRYTGISIGFQLGTVLGGGLGPVIAQWLVSIDNESTTLVSGYIVLVAVIALISVLFLTRKTQKNLEVGEPA